MVLLQIGFTVGKSLPPSGSLSFGFLSFQNDKQEAPGGELGLDQCFSILVAHEDHLGSLKVTDSQVPPAEILICLVVGGHSADDSDVLPILMCYRD